MKQKSTLINTPIIKITILMIGVLLMNTKSIGQYLDSTIRLDYFNKPIVITYNNDNIFSSYYVNTQQEKIPIVVLADSMPKFCYNQTEFIENSFHWPTKTEYLDVMGRITFGALIDSAGCLREVRLLYISPLPEKHKFTFIEEGEKVVWSMNCWKPAIENGKKVNTMKAISIHFKQ